MSNDTTHPHAYPYAYRHGFSAYNIWASTFLHHFIMEYYKYQSIDGKNIVQFDTKNIIELRFYYGAFLFHYSISISLHSNTNITQFKAWHMWISHVTSWHVTLWHCLLNGLQRLVTCCNVMQRVECVAVLLQCVAACWSVYAPSTKSIPADVEGMCRAQCIEA